MYKIVPEINENVKKKCMYLLPIEAKYLNIWHNMEQWIKHLVFNTVLLCDIHVAISIIFESHTIELESYTIVIIS